jgi:hypothetical protein
MTSSCHTGDSAAAGVGVEIGTRLDEVAAALSTYEIRNGRAATASQLLGAGVDLGPQDGPTKPAMI